MKVWLRASTWISSTFAKNTNNYHVFHFNYARFQLPDLATTVPLEVNKVQQNLPSVLDWPVFGTRGIALTDTARGDIIIAGLVVAGFSSTTCAKDLPLSSLVVRAFQQYTNAHEPCSCSGQRPTISSSFIHICVPSKCNRTVNRMIVCSRHAPYGWWQRRAVFRRWTW